MLQLNRTRVPIPFAYDAMKYAYVGKETRCAMMVGVDLLGQCPDSNPNNNFGVFPVILKVNESTGKSNFIYKIYIQIVLYVY